MSDWDDKRAADLALAAAKEAVRQTQNELFSLLGYNIADAQDIKRLQSDFFWLRIIRTGAVWAGAGIGVSILASFGMGIVWVISEGVKAALRAIH